MRPRWFYSRSGFTGVFAYMQIEVAGWDDSAYGPILMSDYALHTSYQELETFDG